VLAWDVVFSSPKSRVEGGRRESRGKKKKKKGKGRGDGRTDEWTVPRIDYNLFTERPLVNLEEEGERGGKKDP